MTATAKALTPAQHAAAVHAIDGVGDGAIHLEPGDGRGASVRLHPLSDLGNADAFLAEHGEDLRYVPAWRSWLVWDGRRWAIDDVATVAGMAKDYAADALAKAAERTADGGPDKELVKHVLRSQDARGLHAMLDVAAMDARLTLRPDELDAEPMALTCANGIVDLATGKLGPHDRARLHTKMTPVIYDPRARSELWESVLARAVPDPEVRALLQRAAGYSLSGDVREECLFVIHGPTGANGKSTVMETVRATAGDYARTADFDTFLAGRQVGGPHNDIAALAGARLVVSVEVDDGRALAAAIVKTLTGGDTVSARRLYQESFEFRPCLKLWLVCNHAPRARDDDPALWRRIHRIPFDVTIPEAERDPTLKARLRQPEHLAAVLAWAVEGCRQWLAGGLNVPQAIRAATAAYRVDQDPLADFLADCCTLEPDASVTKKALRDAYGTYCAENGEHRPIGAKRLKESLTARGITDAKSGNARLWRGLSLTVQRGE